jgi:hypothetical protein
VSKKISIRYKRFVLNDKLELQGLWSANTGEILELSYDYSPSVTDFYRELIEVAVENFNRFGLARLQYRRMAMGVHFAVCSLDSEYLKTKHKNPIIFSEKQSFNANTTVMCRVKDNKIFYDPRFHGIFIDDKGGDNVTLPPFAEIICNTAHRDFQRIGVGVILHEINHLFGVKHSHSLEETNGILNVNIARPDLNSIPKDKFSKLFSVYNYGSFFQVTNYTLISPFSIQHYRSKALVPYRSLNETRINELLASYSLQPQIKLDYFYLLAKYAGYPILYTYQDIAGLATAIYHIAPDSLMGKTFNFPNYFLVQGIYLPELDSLKLKGLVDALYEAEQFVYPIFAQENVTIPIELASYFRIDLYKNLKIVNLSKRVVCRLAQEDLTHLPGNVTLRNDCWLSGKLERLGIFPLSIELSKKAVSTVHFLQLLVSKERENFKAKVLLGNPNTTYFMTGTTYVNIVDICQAVALPPRSLNCQVENGSAPLIVHLERCWYLLRPDQANHSLSFIIFNGVANKTCNIQFLFNQSVNLENELLFNLSDNEVLQFNGLAEQGYAVANVRENWIMHQASPALMQVTSPAFHPEIFSRFAQQFNYCVTVPFIHGILERLVDDSSLPVCMKSALKLLPRVGLWYLDYLNLLTIGLLCVPSFLEVVLKTSLRDKASKSLEKFIYVLIVVGMAELEYGFSNLWLLSDKLRFWPMLTDKLNQLFLQLLFAPMVKACGYAISLDCIKSRLTLPANQDVQSITELSLLSNDNGISKKSADDSCSFFSAMHIASQSVFSTKTIRLFSFFSRSGRGKINQENKTDEQADRGEERMIANESFAKVY